MNNLISLKDFIHRQISGDWGKNLADEIYNHEVYCIRGADINAVNEGNYNDLPIRYIEAKAKTKFLEEGNIIIEVSGGSPTQSTGRVCYVRGKSINIICSNFCRAYEIKKEHSPKFFYYLVKNIYNSNIFFNFESKTTGIKNLLIESAFENIKVPQIDFNDQKSIAKVLSDLDAKIELNNKINRELEAMAKTLYDYWFVQFDFPNADGKPYKSSGGKMVYNAELKREIPEGWEVKKLGKVLKTVLGGTPSTKKHEFWQNGEYHWLNSGEIANFPVITSEHKITEEAILNSATGLMPKGTVAISITRHIRPSILAIDACANQSVVGILETDLIRSSYLFPLIRNEVPRYLSLRTGAQQPHINKQTIDKTIIVVPKSDVLYKYYKIANPIYNQIINFSFQNQHLTALRDWLLPMLMNGQVTVKQAEEKLSMAAEPSVKYGS